MAALISPDHSEFPPHPRLKLGVMASGSGSNFEAIAQSIQDGHLNAEIQVVIYNNPDAKVVDRAQRFNVPAVLLNHREFGSREELDQAIVTSLKNYQVDWVVMAGWMRIVTPVLINAFPNRILNIHPSLLPSFKGNRAEVDSGKIIIQAAVPILEGDTVEALQNRIHAQEHQIYPAAIAIAAIQTQH
ncbi:MAG: phosphoribosylglycinamide formyltransferase [Leptolyngbya sp. Prado105]|nr:phosphoribosylglycinamide formyltransferase [Leptolyngbya sp. Prado105]